MFNLYNSAQHKFLNKKFYNISDILKQYLQFKNTKKEVKIDNKVSITKKDGYLDFLLYISKANPDFKCDICGCKANHFRVEVDSATKCGHFHLFGIKHIKKTKSALYCFFNKDHIVPKSLGGSDSNYNMRFVCEECNTKRGNDLSNIDKEILNNNLNIKCINRYINALGIAKRAIKKDNFCKSTISKLIKLINDNKKIQQELIKAETKKEIKEMHLDNTETSTNTPTKLSDRQKAYENDYNIKLPKNSTFLIRLDGKGFSKNIKKWKCEQPFDKYFHEAMIDTTEYLMREISDINMAWTGSDEITLLFNAKQNTEVWFNNRISKLLSLTASMASVKFNNSMISNLKMDVYKYPAIFDARIINPPDLMECLNNIVYRQQDCIRNSISMWYAKFYSHKEAMKKNSEEKINELKNKKSFDWNIDAPDWTKYGTLFYYVNTKKINEDNEEYFRNILTNKSNIYTGTSLYEILTKSLNKEI